MDIVDIITDIYLPKAKELGLEKIVSYNFDDFISKNN
jgi:hypothetical protein